MAGHFLLLDIGGTYIKSGRTDSSGNLCNVLRFAVPTFQEAHNNERELLLSELSFSCSEAIKSQIESDREKPLGILVSGQMAGYSISDTNNEQIGNVVSWQDQRANNEIDRETTWDWASTKLPLEIQESLGNEYRVNLPLLSIAHRLRKGELERYSQIKFNSLLWWALTPLLTESKDISHITDAAASGLYDLQNKRWFVNPYRTWGLSIDFPEVVSTITPIGYYLDTSIPVYAPVGDQQASLLGTGISESKTIVNIGTGGQVARILSKDENQDEYPFAQVRPYFDNQQFLTVTHLPSGRAFSSAVLTTCGGNSQKDFEHFRSLCLSEGEVSPLPLDIFPYKANEVANIVSDLGEEKFARSFLAEMVTTYSKALQNIGFNSKLHKLSFAGGVGQKFPELTSKLSEFTNASSSVSDSEETTLEGLALIAAKLLAS